MAFNNVGPVTFLAAGQSVGWNYSFGGDRGTQFASADIKTPNQGGVHLADLQRKEKDNNGNATYFVESRTKDLAAPSTIFREEECHDEDDHCG